MVYWGYVSQSAEQNELALSESVTTGTSEEDIVKIDKIYCNTVANGLSNGAMPDTKKALKTTLWKWEKICGNVFLI